VVGPLNQRADLGGPCRGGGEQRDRDRPADPLAKVKTPAAAGRIVRVFGLVIVKFPDDKEQ
jgi:hypothetical protein